MSMTANQNHDDASSSGNIKTCDKDNVRPWSDLNHDVLSLVMMQLGFFDFFAFCGVCKSMRSVALANRKRFMVSKPPMLMRISNTTTHSYNDKECCLEDYEGRKFKTILRNSVCSTLVGSTCDVDSNCIWYSIAGEGEWNRVSSTFNIYNLYVFKKKIYTICSDANSWKVRHLRELTLNPKPELTLVETKNFLNEAIYSSLLLVEDTREEHEPAIFLSNYAVYGAAVKPESWADSGSQHIHHRFVRHSRFFTANQWYFPHECLNVNLLDES
ncbi:unnamed protein product [Lactuca virosa]|uniref:F-box domain-containing protein n=1 Tax=Lactuca virosa TaxID=75947 RepID=A0AAU9NAP6_9ASTR|nr:unnamed protein product [Lactuca virosa]